jgi:hypothetical protein
MSEDNDPRVVAELDANSPYHIMTFKIVDAFNRRSDGYRTWMDGTILPSWYDRIHQSHQIARYRPSEFVKDCHQNGWDKAHKFELQTLDMSVDLLLFKNDGSTQYEKGLWMITHAGQNDKKAADSVSTLLMTTLAIKQRGRQVSEFSYHDEPLHINV